MSVSISWTTTTTATNCESSYIQLISSSSISATWHVYIKTPSNPTTSTRTWTINFTPSGIEGSTPTAGSHIYTTYNTAIVTITNDLDTPDDFGFRFGWGYNGLNSSNWYTRDSVFVSLQSTSNPGIGTSYTVTCLDYDYPATKKLGTLVTREYVSGATAYGSDWGTASPYAGYIYYMDSSTVVNSNSTVYRYFKKISGTDFSNTLNMNGCGSIISCDNSSDYPWEGSTSSGGAIYSPQNLNVASATSSIVYTVNLTKVATFSCNYVISSEANYDKGYIYIDGVIVLTDSGSKTSTFTSEELTTGTHTIELRYTKDGSVNSGTDNFTVSNMKLDINDTLTISDLKYWGSCNHNTSFIYPKITVNSRTYERTVYFSTDKSSISSQYLLGNITIPKNTTTLQASSYSDETLRFTPLDSWEHDTSHTIYAHIYNGDTKCGSVVSFSAKSYHWGFNLTLDNNKTSVVIINLNIIPHNFTDSEKRHIAIKNYNATNYIHISPLDISASTSISLPAGGVYQIAFAQSVDEKTWYPYSENGDGVSFTDSSTQKWVNATYKEITIPEINKINYYPEDNEIKYNGSTSKLNSSFYIEFSVNSYKEDRNIYITTSSTYNSSNILSSSVVSKQTYNPEICFTWDQTKIPSSWKHNETYTVYAHLNPESDNGASVSFQVKYYEWGYGNITFNEENKIVEIPIHVVPNTYDNDFSNCNIFLNTSTANNNISNYLDSTYQNKYFIENITKGEALDNTSLVKDYYETLHGSIPKKDSIIKLYFSASYGCYYKISNFVYFNSNSDIVNSHSKTYSVNKEVYFSTPYDKNCEVTLKNCVIDSEGSLFINIGISGWHYYVRQANLYMSKNSKLNYKMINNPDDEGYIAGAKEEWDYEDELIILGFGGSGVKGYSLTDLNIKEGDKLYFKAEVLNPDESIDGFLEFEYTVLDESAHFSYTSEIIEDTKIKLILTKDSYIKDKEYYITFYVNAYSPDNDKEWNRYESNRYTFHSGKEKLIFNYGYLGIGIPYKIKIEIQNLEEVDIKEFNTDTVYANEFNWTNPKIKGEKFNLTADEWKSFRNKLFRKTWQARIGAGRSGGYFEKNSKLEIEEGKPFTAEIYNEIQIIINYMINYDFILLNVDFNEKEPNNKITAKLFENLAIALNAKVMRFSKQNQGLEYNDTAIKATITEE